MSAKTRRIERKIVKIMRTDGDRCSLCRADFESGGRTYGGIARDGCVALACESCLPKMQTLHTAGLYLDSQGALDLLLTPARGRA